MMHPDFLAAQVLMAQMVAEKQREAEIHRLRHQARAGRRSRLSRQGCWLLSRFGHLLVALGQRLQQVGSVRLLSQEPADHPPAGLTAG